MLTKVHNENVVRDLGLLQVVHVIASRRPDNLGGGILIAADCFGALCLAMTQGVARGE